MNVIHLNHSSKATLFFFRILPKIYLFSYLANKAVFNCEYKTTFDKCSQAIKFKMSTIEAPISLDGKNMKMCNLQGQLIPF